MTDRIDPASCTHDWRAHWAAWQCSKCGLLCGIRYPNPPRYGTGKTDQGGFSAETCKRQQDSKK